MIANRIGVVAVLAAATAGCGPGADGAADRPARAQSRPADARPASPDVSVTVRTFMFRPDPVQVRRGQTVTWTNSDSTVHTVTSGNRARPDGRFDDRLAASGGTSSQTFPERGSHRYFCSLHSGPGMEGVVVVR